MNRDAIVMVGVVLSLMVSVGFLPKVRPQFGGLHTERELLAVFIICNIIPELL